MSFKEIALINSDISKNQVKKLDGIRKNSERVRSYLIGQIGKNFAIIDNPINLGSILDEVYAIIDKAKALIGGRAVILECERSDSLIAYYKKHGFEVLINTKDEALVTMYTYIT
ncbi:hypothetical protein P4S72_27190 [Vibrio sp. PP-XX7]